MRLKFSFLLLILTLYAFGQVQKSSTLQVGNTSTNSISSSALLQIDDTSKGFLPPRLTTLQRDAIDSPIVGLTIFNTTLNCIEWYTSLGWNNACGNEFISKSSGGTAVISVISCATASIGDLTLGIPASGVKQTITVNVTKTGTYNISTIENSGIVFLGSGVFVNTGIQVIDLTAIGTPFSSAGSTKSNFSLNTTPSCIFVRAINNLITPISIVNTITLKQSQKYLVASAYDTDYLPYTAPTSAALSSSLAADAINESYTVNIQGTIDSSTGINVNIPVTATASGTLPAYSTTINIPSNNTEDGVSRNVTFSWPQQTYTLSTKIITASIKAVGGTLNVKKLDVNSGLGSDYLGVLIGTFTYPYNSLGTTSTFEIRAVPLIPDKMAGLADFIGNTNSHMMFYAPVVAEDGKIWLNNNLGAKYSNIVDLNFNPVQQAKSTNDFNAYSSLFQWGRKADGHELINWQTGSYGSLVYLSTTTRSDIPSSSQFITNATIPQNWRLNPDDYLWATESSVNNPCPVGFKVPTVDDFNNLITFAGIVDANTTFGSSLKFSFSGNRDYSTGSLYSTGNGANYWTSNTSGNYGISRFFATTSIGPGNDQRAYGFSIRCIKN
jgi:uncharacterized protein (TIGR02145 family)